MDNLKIIFSMKSEKMQHLNNACHTISFQSNVLQSHFYDVVRKLRWESVISVFCKSVETLNMVGIMF